MLNQFNFLLYCSGICGFPWPQKVGHFSLNACAEQGNNSIWCTWCGWSWFWLAAHLCSIIMCFDWQPTCASLSLCVSNGQPYLCGRCKETLKWKPPSLNSVDFRLKICKEQRPGWVAWDCMALLCLSPYLSFLLLYLLYPALLSIRTRRQTGQVDVSGVLFGCGRSMIQVLC